MIKDKTIIYTLNINENDENRISKILNISNNFIVNNLKILELFEHARKGNLKYLVIRVDDNSINDLDFIYQNRGYFVSINVLFIVTAGSDVKSSYTECFNRAVFTETGARLIEDTCKVLEFLSPVDVNENNPIYLPLDYKVFSNIKRATCDIFIKLSEIKYVKILSRGDEQAPKQVINKYTNKGVKELYILASDLEHFKEFFKEEIFKIDSSASLVEQKLQIAESVIAVACDFGVSQFLVDGINNSFSEISKELGSDKKLKDILKKLKESEGSALANHSYLTAIFAALICSKISWATSHFKKNISLASMLHDIELTNSPHLGYEFKSLNEINSLDPKSASFFKNHGLRLAETLSKNSAIPADVINLIAKHHEGSKDNSYPHAILGGQLSPPSCLFNVAHRFSIELSKVAFNYKKLDLAIMRLREFYAGGAMFKSFIDILESELITKKHT